jgi:hypothetical protein
MKKKISIITPTFNEGSNIEKLCLLISGEMSKLDYEYEHIVIDNSSTDWIMASCRRSCSSLSAFLMNFTKGRATFSSKPGIKPARDQILFIAPKILTDFEANAPIPQAAGTATAAATPEDVAFGSETGYFTMFAFSASIESSRKDADMKSKTGFPSISTPFSN